MMVPISDPRGTATSEQVRRALAEGTRATVVGLAVSSMLATIKVGTGVLGNSFALIADGVESILDIFGALLVWGGLKASGTEPSDRFPYGRGKAEHLAALAIATMMLGAAGAIAIGALSEIRVPHQTPAPFTLPILAAVVIAKEVLFRVLRAKGERLGSQVLSTDAWHHRSDAATSLAAFVGISVSLVGGEGFESADDWAALFACGVIAWNATRLLRSAVQEILDVSAPDDVVARVRELASAQNGVAGIDLLRVRRSGLVYLVDIHVEVDGDLSVTEGHTIAHGVKGAILESELPVLDALVHIEPDSRAATGASGRAGAPEAEPRQED